MKIGYLIVGIDSIKGGGGAERFATNIISEHKFHGNYELDVLVDDKSWNVIREYRDISEISKRSVRITGKSKMRFFTSFLFLIKSLKYDKIIIANHNYKVDFLLFYYKILPKKWLPKLVLVGMDCIMAYALEDESHRDHKHFKEMFKFLFSLKSLTQVITYYDSMIKINARIHFVQKHVKFNLINTRHHNFENNYPVEKKSLMVWAGRLSDQKRPQLFLKMVEKIRELDISVYNHFKFILLGSGYKLVDLVDEKEKLNLDRIELIQDEVRIDKYLNQSQIFISTQKYDNFPSLSMIEAMASGNAIFAINEGRTNIFVKSGINGEVVELNVENYSSSLAEKIVQSINQDKIKEFGLNSRQLALEMTPKKFYEQFNKFVLE
jgi:glycosyltransferase involved in cell wall biosynthesis